MPQGSLEISNNEAMEPYTYQPLAQGCIRLIRLLPGHYEDPIQCEISSYTMRPSRVSGPFDALSYVWGDTQQPGTVYVRNLQQNTTRPLSVTKNLHAALTQLRDPEISRTLWIDAICINQGDLEERASQVRMMAQIYSRAARVIVWLGQAAEDSEAVFDVLLLLAQKRSLRLTQRFSHPQHDEDPDLACIVDLKIHPLKALLRRAWFNRIWVLQEVAAARCVSITCGTSELMGIDFLRGLKVWFEVSGIDHHDHLDLMHSIFYLIDKEVAGGLTPFAHYIPENGSDDTEDEESSWQAREIKRASWAGVRLDSSNALQIAPLVDLLERFQAHAATDRRDKVYALLGMCTDDTNHPGLRVDYSKDWATIFTDLIRYFLGTAAIVSTWNTEEVALIRGRGCPLGTLRGEGYNWYFTGFSSSRIKTAKVEWEFGKFRPSIADDIKAGDILCLMQGARLPSLIRRCGEYFVVVKIAILDFPGVSLWKTRFKISDATSSMTWSEFLPCISQFSRDFLLIWDRSPKVKTCANHHHRLIESISTGETSTEKLTRYFNMARILEDLEETTVLEDMLSSPSAPQPKTASPMARYFELLRLMCKHWESYKKLKALISQLRWSRWVLNSSGAVDPITDFWKSEGLFDCDLYETLSMVERYDRSKDSFLSERGNESWEFGEVTIQPLLKSISQSFARIASETATGSSEYLSRRYLTHVVFHQARNSNLNPAQPLGLLSARPQLLEAARFCLASLAEVEGIKEEMTLSLLPRESSASQVMDWRGMSSLLETSFHDCPSIVNMFEQAQRYALLGRREHFETYSQFLIPRAAVIHKCILTTELCDALIEQWDSLPVGHMSVLEFLCNIYTSNYDRVCVYAELYKRKFTFYPPTKRGRINLARKCLITSICDVAPWVGTRPKTYNAIFENIDRALDMLWASKPSSDDLTSTTSRLAIDA